MNTRLLTYFVKLVETENFTRAAEQLHIAQPALSVAIKKLEQQSPSIIPLTAGMKDFMYKDFESAKPKLLRAAFINIYGDVSLAERRAAEYYSPRITEERKDEIIGEVNTVISKMKFSQEEYKKCDPKSESTRLMLAQWAAYPLNIIQEFEEKVGYPWEREGSKENPKYEIEKLFWKIEFPIKEKVGKYVRGPPHIFEKGEFSYYVKK